MRKLFFTTAAFLFHAITNPAVYIFVDESGDLGFTEKSEPLFFIAALCVDDPAIIDRKVIRPIWRTLSKKQAHSSRGELKFNNANYTTRRRFLDKLSKLNVEAGFIYINKFNTNASLREKPAKLYNYLAGILLENMLRNKDVTECTIIGDRCFGKDSQTDFSQYLKKKLETFSGVIPSVKVLQKDSKSEAGLVAADFIAGTVRQKLAKNNSDYYSLINT